MGGSGSGARYWHWWRPEKKTTVEDCLSLDASRWMREGILTGASHRLGSWRWKYRSGGGFTVNYEVRTLAANNPCVRLFYSWTWTSTGQAESVDYRVGLTTTRPRFGGLRWWFVCPLVVRGVPCERRVGKLHLPRRARYFGCRRCYDLTYTSNQEAHEGEALMARVAANLGISLRDVKDVLRRHR